MTRHQNREIRIFGLYNDAVNGQHFSIIRSGTWAEIVDYLNKTVRYRGPRSIFVEGADGKLSPLMA